MPIPNSSPIQQALALAAKWGSLTRQNVLDSPQVAALVRAEGGQLAGDTVEALGNLLTFTAAQFNVGKNLNDMQIALLASEMLRIYWYWRFDEFAFVLREAVAGRYGTTYDRIDAATVHAWCATYEADRNAAQVDAAEQQVRRYKQAEQQPAGSELASHPDFGYAYASLRAQFEALSDGVLLATGKDYENRLGAENEFITLVGWEVYCERKASRHRRQLLEQFAAAGISGQTEAEKEAQRRAEDRALDLALLRGDWQAAGFATAPVIEKLDWNGQPIS